VHQGRRRSDAEKDRRLSIDDPCRINGGAWQWHNDFDFAGVKQRDCAIVVSPRKVLGLTIYEANPLVIEARPGGGVRPSTRHARRNGTLCSSPRLWIRT
jgi:hypothetical protein